MITKNNITEFYEKYRKNLEMEDLLNESVLRAEDEESWIERLRAKSKGLRDMYIENEAMLNLYLRPFLEQESLLTEELAEEFFQQITIMNSLGYCDRVTCIAIGEVLQHYFEKNGNYHHWIRQHIFWEASTAVTVRWQMWKNAWHVSTLRGNNCLVMSR